MTVEAYRKTQQERRIAQLNWLLRNAIDEVRRSLLKLWDAAHLGHDTSEALDEIEQRMQHLGDVTERLAVEFEGSRAPASTLAAVREVPRDTALAQVKPLRDPQVGRRLAATLISASRLR